MAIRMLNKKISYIDANRFVFVWLHFAFHLYFVTIFSLHI